jgi:hypothetical protein
VIDLLTEEEQCELVQRQMSRRGFFGMFGKLAAGAAVAIVVPTYFLPLAPAPATYTTYLCGRDAWFVFRPLARGDLVEFPTFVRTSASFGKIMSFRVNDIRPLRLDNPKLSAIMES